MKHPASPWRSTTTRLITSYGVFFVLWALILLSLIYWETSQYLSDEAEHLLAERADYFASIDPALLRDRLESTYEYDLLHMNAYGLFDPNGKLITGNIPAVPPGLEPDGHSHIYPEPFGSRDGRSSSTRILAIRLRDGDELVLARNAGLIDRLHVLISRATTWGLSLTIVPGLLGGLLLSMRPRRRIRELQSASDRIVAGNLGERLPISSSGDELDNLAGIVNSMLDQIERLMFEVKSVCDNVAHDLRTPLTHLRSQLYRLQQQTRTDDQRLPVIDHLVAETDDLLARFSALLRISELKDEHRRAAFTEVDLIEILEEVRGLYEPLAEEQAITFEFDHPASASVKGDRYLLLEAFSNLVGNAIKFTPENGRVIIRVAQQDSGPQVDVIDTGPGIKPEHREAIFNRFYRVDQGRSTPGFGLGLSIVEAIMHLHGFHVSAGDAPSGACLTVQCWAASILGDRPGKPLAHADRKH